MLCCIGGCIGVSLVLIGVTISGTLGELGSSPVGRPNTPLSGLKPPPTVRGQSPGGGDRVSPGGTDSVLAKAKTCPAPISCKDCPAPATLLLEKADAKTCPVPPPCPKVAQLDGSGTGGAEPALADELSKSSSPDSAFRHALAAYAKLHNGMVSSKVPGPARILNCKPSAQMGNRIRFVASCLLFAMVSDRALLVAFKDGYYASLDDLFVSPGFEWEMARAAGSISTAEGKSLDPKAFETLLCADLGHEGLGDAVTISGNFFFMPYVANNPRYRGRVRRWFPNGNIFGAMARTVFTPNEIVHSMMDGFLLQLGKRHGLPEGQRWSCDVGFQIRNDNDPVQHPQISSKEWELYRKCAEQLLPRSTRKSPNVFVATDSEESRAICKREVPYAFDFFGDFQRSNNPEGVRRALVDLLLFSTCDVMLVSPWSSYGRVASVYAGRQAYFVTDWKMPIGEPHRRYLEVLRDAEDPKAGCFRFQSTEPCPWHGPKGVHGFNDVIKTTTCWDASMLSDTC